MQAYTRGWKTAITDYSIRALNRAGYFQILRCLALREPVVEFLGAAASLECRFLKPEEVRRHAADPAYKMPADFLEVALAKGDACYGILDGGRLASFGWYATSPTEIEDGGLDIRVSSEWVYMYKAYTLPEYRGRRLHAVGVTQCLEHYGQSGYRGLISYVAATNHSSLKSCLRMGYVDFGSIAVSGIGGGFRIWHSAGCAGYGVRVAVTP